MRTSKEIMAQIKSISAKDKLYNNLVNEGGEGYERNSVPETLYAEFEEAKNAEFKVEWTLDVFIARREQFNIACHAAKSSSEVLYDFPKKHGWGRTELLKAKKLLGIK